MIILWSHVPSESDSFDLTIDCPGCKRRATPAFAKDYTVTTKLYYVLPVLWLTSHRIKCKRCGHEFKANHPAAELAGFSPQQVADSLAKPPPGLSIVYKILTVLGILIFLFPIVGLAFSVLGLMGSIKKGSAWRFPGFVGVGLNVIWNAFFFINYLRHH